MAALNSRFVSLDAFRGVTVAAMILVNNPGSWGTVYAPFLHAEWHGCTPTDLIFPFFLFIVGTSIHFAYLPKLESGLTREVVWKISKRALIIFGLGAFLSLFPNFNFQTVRIPGVLQRIAVVFWIVSLLNFKLGWAGLIRVAALLLVSYYFMMQFIPVPGFGVANLEKGTNLAAWLDSLLLERHMWSQTKTWDPEGILSTIPAVATCLLGVLAGKLLLTEQTSLEKTVWMFLVGVALVVLGLWWSLAFPMNKALWTSSFVLYTGGLAFQGLAIFYYFIDVRGFQSWALPLRYYGVNALFVFVASGLLAKILYMVKIGENSLWGIVYQAGYASWLPPHFASLMFALSLVVLFGLLLRWMYHKNIIVKV